MNNDSEAPTAGTGDTPVGGSRAPGVAGEARKSGVTGESRISGVASGSTVSIGEGSASELITLDIQRVMLMLPHRYPFLLIDRVIGLVRGEYIHALKNVTVNEPFFPGHFPSRPVMPGVLILEALAQACGILTFETERVIPEPDARFYFVGIDKARFRKPVMPGDQLILKAKLMRTLRNIWKFETVAEVDGREVASGEIMCTPEAKGTSAAARGDAVQTPATVAPR